MKLVTAIIRPEKFPDVRDALEAHGVHSGLTVSQAHGYGRQRGHTEVYRGAEFRSDLLSKVRLEILTTDEAFEEVVGVIVESAGTGATGDGKIWVVSVADAARVRTGERGQEAVS